VVLLVVAAVVALGVAWEHSSEAGWITPPEAGRIPARIAVHGTPPHPPGTVIRPGGRVYHLPAPGGPGIGLNLSDTANLTRTAEIEAAVIAGVVVLDIIRRRLRRARRAAR
jgi:hypothetical protein